MHREITLKSQLLHYNVPMSFGETCQRSSENFEPSLAFLRLYVRRQEDDRRRLARELHDELGQLLSLLKINLQLLRDAWPGNDPPSRLKESLELSGRTIEYVRNLAVSARPSILDDLGLVETVRWFAKDVQQTSGLIVQMHSSLPNSRLPEEIETAAFRIVQEALTNAVRHAAAQSVAIRMQIGDGGIEFAICDDGCGFDVPSVQSRALGGATLGLLEMKARAMLTGGKLWVESQPGAGASVKGWLPLQLRTHICNE